MYEIEKDFSTRTYYSKVIEARGRDSDINYSSILTKLIKHLKPTELLWAFSINYSASTPRSCRKARRTARCRVARRVYSGHDRRTLSYLSARPSVSLQSLPTARSGVFCVFAQTHGEWYGKRSIRPWDDTAFPRAA